MSLRARSKTSIGTPTNESTSTSNADEHDLIQDTSTLSSSLSQRTISQTLAGTAHLAKLLPTGTLLAFQLLTPIFTNNGICDSVTRLLTLLLLLVLSASCFLACLTDSFKSPDGKVYYGLATLKGMWLFDYQTTLGSSLPDLSRYRLRFIDAIHSVLSVLVFTSIALRDKNVLGCFYPKPQQKTQEVLDIIPIGIGLICSLLFVVFPTTRQGVGYPITLGAPGN